MHFIKRVGFNCEDAKDFRQQSIFVTFQMRNVLRQQP
jgi:hypothetical protein